MKDALLTTAVGTAVALLAGTTLVTLAAGAVVRAGATVRALALVRTGTTGATGALVTRAVGTRATVGRAALGAGAAVTVVVVWEVLVWYSKRKTAYYPRLIRTLAEHVDGMKRVKRVWLDRGDDIEGIRCEEREASLTEVYRPSLHYIAAELLPA